MINGIQAGQPHDGSFNLKIHEAMMRAFMKEDKVKLTKEQVKKHLLDMLYCEEPNCQACADKMDEILETITWYDEANK